MKPGWIQSCLNVVSLTIVCICTAEMDNIHNSTANFTKPVTTSAANSTFFYYSNASSSTSLSSLTDHVGTEVETIFTGQSSPLTTPSSPSSASNQFTNNISQASNITVTNATLFYTLHQNDSFPTRQTESTTQYSTEGDRTITKGDEATTTTSSSWATASRLSNTTHPSNATTPRNENTGSSRTGPSQSTRNVREFLDDRTRQDWSSSTAITETSTQKTSSSTPAHLSTEKPRLSASNPTSPWDTLASSLQNGNHFHPIVNVNVDSNSAESLEKFRRLEEMITNRINAMEKVAENHLSVLKTRISQLEAAIANVKCPPTDTRELKHHLELLFNNHTNSLEAQFKSFVQRINVIANSNEPAEITDKIVPKTTLVPTNFANVDEARIADNDDSLAAWRAKRTKWIEKWENTFQKGLTTRKKTLKRSTQQGSS